MSADLIINPGELAELAPGSCVVFDCRFSLVDHQMGLNAYRSGHIPGAHYLDMEKDLAGDKNRTSGRHPLPDAEVFAQKMRDCGVNQDTLIVCYDDQRLAGAARLWWLLNYFGHRNTKVLNGGLNAWQKSDLSISTAEPDKAPLGNFIAKPNADMQTSQERLLADIEMGQDLRAPLIDSREAPRFQGKEEPIDPIAGHIPGALNYPWQGVTNGDGTIKAVELQQQRWATLNDHPDGITVYCGSGVTASVNLFSMQLAGIENGKLYAGSWSQWCAEPDNPIVTQQDSTC